jgi:glycosyltransferase involved in cell wall biosynthesis
MPYLAGASQNGHRITIVSCEKPERLAKDAHIIKALLTKYSIDWKPVVYSNETPVLSSLLTVRRMYRAAKRVMEEKKVELIHCRSTLPALAGLKLKKKYGQHLIYDMRGFWADERVEGGIWPQDKIMYRMIYRYIKKQEEKLLRLSDHIISLTQAAKDIMQSGSHPVVKPITVIPCCADYNHFNPSAISAEEKKNKKQSLGIHEGQTVIIYTGSIGTWYMLDEMMMFFKVFSDSIPDSIFLFVTKEAHEQVSSAAANCGVHPTSVKTVSAGRNEMPLYLSLADASLYFILPVYSKKASSPVKQGESLAMGIPVITNAAIGDSDALISGNNLGWLIHSFSNTEYERVSRAFMQSRPDKEKIRSTSSTVLSLEKGIKLYVDVYASFQ